MVNSMLDHSKLVLKKVSFDTNLFKKELLKAVNWLNPVDVIKFEEWCFSHFETEHRQILITVFNKVEYA